MKSIKVLVISPGQDNGGIGYAIKQAFDRYSDIEVRAVRASNNYINFRSDLVVPSVSRTPEMLGLYRWADVVHMMEYFAAIEWAPSWERKPRLIHHHSASARPQIIERAVEEGIMQISALPTVAIQDDAVTWVPNPCDDLYLTQVADRSAKMRSAHRRPLITQSPSGRAKNGTDHLISAYDSVSDRADLDIIERVQWTACMARKAVSDIGFDSFTTGYGISGVEYMALGVPLISGATDQRVEDMIIERGGRLPYWSVKPNTLPFALGELVDSPDLRSSLADAGFEYMTAVHSERNVVMELETIYEQVMEEA